MLVRALREPWATPRDLAGIVRGVIDRDPAIGTAMARAAAAWPRRAPLAEIAGPAGMNAVAADPLLLAVLETGKVVGIELERFLTTLRAGLLELARVTSGHTDEVLRLCCALARQSVINEYVFDQSDDEQARVAELRREIDVALVSRQPLAALAVAILAAYVPLGGETVGALSKLSWPRSLTELLAELEREQSVAQRHRKAILPLSGIVDATSIAVARQYEENPYPRWVALPKLVRPRPIDDWFHQEFPSSGYRPIGKGSGLDVLIAGCGTGHHSILFAQSFPAPRVLAVDLSLSSLSYAREKSRAMGLDIEYAQADILELGALKRRFDIISASGVLHHLADPEQGWRVLLSLLRPNGGMHVGLYSEMAGRSIAAARDWLTARGFGTTPDEIRRARQHLIAAVADFPMLADVLRYPDFYATGECRDLLFHVQERRFTLPQIQAFLDANGLRLIGFNIGADVREEFQRRYPGQSTTDLSLWHDFETARPDTFRGMYQFWVQRRS